MSTLSFSKGNTSRLEDTLMNGTPKKGVKCNAPIFTFRFVETKMHISSGFFQKWYESTAIEDQYIDGAR
ncbi:MAG: hypothetical protein ACLUPK_06675 [Veillonella sp.]